MQNAMSWWDWKRSPDLPGQIKPMTEWRGFASWEKEKLRQNNSEAGRAAHEYGGAHEFTSEEARIAGRKGGFASAVARRAKQKPKKVINPCSINASGNHVFELKPDGRRRCRCGKLDRT